MKKIIIATLSIILVLITVVTIKSLSLKSKQQPIDIPVSEAPEIAGASERLAKAVTFPTVSYDDTLLIDYSVFLDFHEFLKSSFPLCFSELELEVFHQYTLVLKWPGQDDALPPAIFMAHQDVVPVDDDSKDMWTVPAFDGLIRDGILYGRGVIDDKINLMGQLETAEYLLKSGFQPQRSIYFVFGHDEEIGGEMGAAQVAAAFEARGIQAAFVMDEGGIITYDKVPGIERPVALIGTSEKGYVTLELEVNIPGGHSSFPASVTSIDVLSKALSDLRKHPFPAGFAPSVKDFIDYIAPEMPFLEKTVMGNRWLFQPLIYKIYSGSAVGDAMIRTTMVPTILQAGVKENAIPTIARAKVNYRLLPGTSLEEVIAHTKKAINNDLVSIKVMPGPKLGTQTSSPDSVAFRSMMAPLKHHFEDPVVAPFLMIGGTDSRHFYNVTPNIYKFSPMIDPIGFHGIDEQLKISDYKKTLGFYHDFIRSL
jgi:carboxypeptidase PM20D1